MPLATSPQIIESGDSTVAWAAVARNGGGTVPQIAQAQPEWCWAACAQMVLQYYGQSIQQCELASGLFGEPCCDDRDSLLCNEPAQVTDLAGVYQKWGRNAAFIQGQVPFETLQSEIKANRPIEIGFSWSDGGGHQVLVCGWNIDSTGPYLLVNDPKWGSGAVYYVNLQAAYGVSVLSSHLDSR